MQYNTITAKVIAECQGIWLTWLLRLIPVLQPSMPKSAALLVCFIKPLSSWFHTGLVIAAIWSDEWPPRASWPAFIRWPMTKGGWSDMRRTQMRRMIAHARSCFHFFVCLSICLSVFMSVRLSVRLTVFLYILLSVVFVCPLSLDFAVFLYYV